MGYNANVLKLINLTALGYAFTVAWALILSIVRRNPSEKRRMLTFALWFHTLAIACRLVAWSAVQVPNALAQTCLVVGTTCADLFAVFTCLAIMLYIYTDISGDRIESYRTDPIVRILWMLNICNALLVLTNYWTHFYYSFDEQYAYVVGPYLFVRNLLFFLQGVMMVPVVVRLRDRNGLPATSRFICCAALAVVSTIVEALVPGLTVLFPVVSLMLVILSIGVQGRLEEELSEARAEAAESRVRLLSGQIHPHFIFNSLAAIKGLIAEDPELAEETVQDFSDYLRSHLDVMSDTKLIPFADELEHVKRYVSLERAEGSISFEVVYDLEVDDFLVPPLTVQPLVENAIRHGIRTREDGGKVVVSTRQTPEGVRLCVQDDGYGFSSVTPLQRKRRRVGIENVRERLERQCGGTLTVESTEQGAVATMIIPGEDAL